MGGRPFRRPTFRAGHTRLAFSRATRGEDCRSSCNRRTRIGVALKHERELSTTPLTRFYETRWQRPLAIVVVGIVSFFAARILATSRRVDHVLFAITTICVLYAILRAAFPLAVVQVERDEITIRGVRPGWWNLFQFTRRVRVKDSDIVSIGIARSVRRSTGCVYHQSGSRLKARCFRTFCGSAIVTMGIHPKFTTLTSGTSHGDKH